MIEVAQAVILIGNFAELLNGSKKAAHNQCKILKIDDLAQTVIDFTQAHKYIWHFYRISCRTFTFLLRMQKSLFQCFNEK